jgi:heme exporter protein D
MLDLGPHASFIIAAYGVTAIAIAGLVLATVADDLKQRHLLAELERQGIKRRSAAKAPPRASKPAAKAKAPRSSAKKSAPKRKAASPRKRKTPS